MAQTFSTIVSIVPEDKLIQFYQAVGNDKNSLRLDTKSFRGRQFEEEFFGELTQCLQEYGQANPSYSGKAAKVTIVLPNRLVLCDSVNVPGSSRKATNTMAGTAIDARYRNAVDLKINRYVTAANKQYSTVSLVVVRQRVIQNLYTSCATSNMFANTVTFAGNSTVNGAMALNAKLRGGNFVLLDVKQSRTNVSFVAKGIALISVSLIGVLSRTFLREDIPSSWRMVYLIPVITAVVIGLLSYFFVRETPVFLEQRRSFLSLTPEERTAKAEEDRRNSTSEEGGVFRAVKFIFKNRQLRWILIAGFLFFATTFYTSYYATVLEGAMTTDMVSSALIIYPLFNGLVTIASGFFSDKLGRKKVCLLLGGMALAGLLLFVLSCRLGWGPVAAGTAYGCSIGGLWSMSDTIILTMPAESSPSGMRSSVMGTISVLIGAGMFVGQALFIVLQNFLPMDLLFLLICVPFMAISLLVLLTKVKETKNVELDSITAETFL